MLEVYTGQTEKKKRPLLRLSKDGEGQLDIILVDDAGAPLADFWQIAEGGGEAFTLCEGALECQGYDTTWQSGTTGAASCGLRRRGNVI